MTPLGFPLIQPFLPETQSAERAASPSRRDVVCISSIDWDFIWQGHQEIMSNLAAQGNRVLFVENTGIRSVNWSDMPRLKKRLSVWWHSVRGFREGKPNLYIYSPLGLPFPYSRLAQIINRWFITRDLHRWIKIVQFDNPIVWTFLPTPLAADIIQSLNPKLVIYYCIDHFAASSPAARKIQRAEHRMLEIADLVFVTSRQLFDSARQHNSNVHLFPFGVNSEQFERVRDTVDRPTPSDIAQIPRPRIGYVGGVHRWLDVALLQQLATSHPRFHFILVGPLQTDVVPLQGLPNVHFLGSKPHESLPDYIRGFDVGMIPYRLTEYTDHVYPTKTNEYLAMGKPVISTPLKEVRYFNERHGEFIALGSTAEEWGKQIEEILARGENDRDQRIAVAGENSWQVKIRQMAELIDQKLLERAKGKELRWRELFLKLYRQTQRKLIAMFTVVGLSFGLLFYTPLPWFAADPLYQTDPPQRADAIVVFAGGVGESGKAGQGYEERVQRAVELFRAGYADRMIFSSGYVHLFHEPEVMKALAVSLGVPAQSILLEIQATDTYQNVKYVSHILEQHGWNSVLLVSSPYHMRRASLVFSKVAPSLLVVKTPVEKSYFYSRRSRGMTVSQFQAVLHEYAAIVYYWFKGRV